MDTRKARRRRWPRTITTALVGCACLVGSSLLLQIWRRPQEDTSGGSNDEEFTSPRKAVFLNRPFGTPLIMNIGSNVNPIVPRPEQDPACMLSLAFEPVVPDRILPHPALHVIPAAVTGEETAQLAVMHLYHPKNAVSSSLAKPAHAAAWNRDNPNHLNMKLVPTLSFGAVLDALADYPIAFLLTDMQGYDFQAVSSVSVERLLERDIPRMKTEVYTHNAATYESVQNDLCRDWWPHMLRAGYVLDGLLHMDGSLVTDTGYRTHAEVAATCLHQETTTTTNDDESDATSIHEMDALWRRSHVEAGPDPIEHYRYPQHSPNKEGPKFSPNEYLACTQTPSRV